MPLGRSVASGPTKQRFVDWRWNSSPATCYTPQGATRCLMFAGFLANPEEIARRIGYRPSRRTGDLVENLFRRYGARAASLLEGQFALLVWNSRKQALIAVTDAIGSIGIHYRADAARIRFSLDIDDLVDDAGRRGPINQRSAALMLRGMGPLPDETFHNDIRRVPPASIVVFKRGATKSTRYWAVDTGNPLRLAGDREYADALDDVLCAVFSGYRHGGKAGLMLSGGLDSATVATLLARHYPPGSVLALTSSAIESPQPDERDCAVSAAHALGFRHQSIRYTVSSLFDVEGGLCLGEGYPLYAHHGLGRSLLAAQRCAGVEVAFTGDGGDHLFPDPLCTVADSVAAGRFPGAWRQLRELARAGSRYSSLARGLASHMLRGLAPMRFPVRVAPAPCATRYAMDLGAEALAACLESPRVGLLPGRRRHLWRLANLNVSFLLQARFSHTRHFGISQRYPLLDRRVIDFFARLPTVQLSRGDRTKHILRNRLSGKLPVRVTERPKAHHGHLFDKALRGNAPAVRELARNSRLTDLGLVDGSTLKRTIDEYLESERAPVPARLLTILAFEDWLRRYF